MIELSRIRKNIGFHKSNIELIQGKIQDFKQFKMDVIFVNFMNLIDNKNFSLLKEINRENLEFWLSKVHNLVIQLPKNCDLSELAIIFQDYFELNPRFFYRILKIFLFFNV